MQFAIKFDLGNLKSEVDEFDIGKLKSTPTDLSKLRNVVKNEVVKKTKYDELVKNVNSIPAVDASTLV